MEFPINQNQFTDLKTGDKFRYRAGLGPYRTEAEVEVVENTGISSTGAYVKVLRITKKGSKSKTRVNETFIAGRLELFALTT